jgi:hypothetical protein
MTHLDGLKEERTRAALACADLVNLKLWDHAAQQAAEVKRLDDAIMAHFMEVKKQYEGPAQDMPPR